MTYSEILTEKYNSNNINKEIDCLKTICLNVTDFCNLKCSYCPHSKGFNSKDHQMTLNTVKEIAIRLKEINYENRITLSGFGEPMTLPWLIDLLYELIDFNVDILTNGLIVPDYKEDIEKLSNNIIVSVHNINNLEIIKENWPNATIRNHDINTNNCELEITNRAGYLNKDSNNNICTCPFYKIMIDYDGSYLLCADDFNRKSYSKDLNIYNVSIEDYFINRIKSVKMRLINNGRINVTPCNRCNINGTRYGLDIVEWYKENEIK